VKFVDGNDVGKSELGNCETELNEELAKA